MKNTLLSVSMFVFLIIGAISLVYSVVMYFFFFFMDETAKVFGLLILGWFSLVLFVAISQHVK